MECCGRGLPGKRWLLEWIVVTVGWSHHHPTKPCLAACWFSLISDDIFHGAELTSVRRKNICSHALGPGQLSSMGGNGRRHPAIIITRGVWGSRYVCNVCGLVLDPAGSEVALQDPYLVLASSVAHAVPRKALGRQSAFLYHFRWKDPAHEEKKAEWKINTKKRKCGCWFWKLEGAAERGSAPGRTFCDGK